MVALVTSSSKGIGKELIKEFAKRGYDVIITYNESKDLALQLKDYILSNYNVGVDAIKCDISKEEDILNLKNTIIKKYNHIDVLVNNAALSLDNSFENKTKDEFMKVLEVNVVGTFLITKHLFSYMDKGCIVNVSSTDSEDTYNEYNIDYSVSKAGINMLTKEEALVLKNIKVIGVMPNWTNTEAIKEMNPLFLENELKRIGQEKLEEPEDVAKRIIELVEDESIKSGEIRRV